MRDKDIAEQENLRGCDYNWKPTLPATPSKTVSATATTITAKGEKATAAQEESNNEAIESFDEIEMEQGSFVTRRIKARAIHQKSHQRLDPPGGGWGLFGWHTVPHDAKEIILTEGEYDAMAVHQATGRPAGSLPNGCRSLPVEVLPMLERFDTIILWMDNDGPGREGAEQFAKKIGVNRCLLVQPDSSIDGKTAPKDANEALLEGMDLENIIRGAEVLPHERILTFKELRTQVLHEMLNPEKYSGVPVPSLPGFTDIIKGFRRGELTVLTGPTGSGKSWNLCMHVSMSRHAH
jgi:twinkle protein